jgi:hypothetical protein
MNIGSIRIQARVSITGKTIRIPVEEVSSIEASIRKLSPLVELYGHERYGAGFSVGHECTFHDGAIEFPVMCHSPTNGAKFTLTEFWRWGVMHRAVSSTKAESDVGVKGEPTTIFADKCGTTQDDQMFELSRDDVRQLRGNNELDHVDPLEDVVETVLNAVGLKTSRRKLVIIGADTETYSPMNVLNSEKLERRSQVSLVTNIQVVNGNCE